MKKIMIVEDDEVIKDELSELLKNSSYLVESVKNFEKAKEEIFKYNPDLILLDINIPYLNGELLLKEIINMSTGKRLGLIIDVIVDNTGLIKSLILEEKKGKRFSREEYELDWSQIAKIGDDIILAKDKV